MLFMLTRRPPPFPRRRDDAIAAVVEQLKNGEWTRLEGAPELERELETFHGSGVTGTKPTVFYLSSGTAALMAILLGHGIGPGDEVITTPYTWGATVSAVLAIGAIPVFADVDPISGLIRPETIEPLITPRTRGILCVHLFGHPCAAAELRRIADRRDILLFEDGSQAHGARLDGLRVGAFGHASAFSCMGLKLLAGSEGGYAVFHDPAAAERAMLYGRHPRGLPPDRAAALGEAGLLDALQLGWRPCAIGAVLVRHALPHLDAENAARRRNGDRLRSALAGVGAVALHHDPPGAEGCDHLLSLVVYPERCGRSRNEIATRMNAAGAGNFHYIPVPIHRLKRLDPHGYDGPRVFWHDQLLRAGADYRATDCPGAEWRCPREITLGFNWTEDDPEAMDQLAAAIRHALGS